MASLGHHELSYRMRYHCHFMVRQGDFHYGDVIMGAIASQITSPTIVYSTVYSDADERKHQSSASLSFVRGIHRGPVIYSRLNHITFCDVVFHIQIGGCGAHWLNILHHSSKWHQISIMASKIYETSTRRVKICVSFSTGPLITTALLCASLTCTRTCPHYVRYVRHDFSSS